MGGGHPRRVASLPLCEKPYQSHPAMIHFPSLVLRSMTWRLALPVIRVLGERGPAQSLQDSRLDRNSQLLLDQLLSHLCRAVLHLQPARIVQGRRLSRIPMAQAPSRMLQACCPGIGRDLCHSAPRTLRLPTLHLGPRFSPPIGTQRESVPILSLVIDRMIPLRRHPRAETRSMRPI